MHLLRRCLGLWITAYVEDQGMRVIIRDREEWPKCGLEGLSIGSSFVKG